MTNPLSIDDPWAKEFLKKSSYLVGNDPTASRILSTLITRINQRLPSDEAQDRFAKRKELFDDLESFFNCFHRWQIGKYPYVALASLLGGITTYFSQISYGVIAFIASALGSVALDIQLTHAGIRAVLNHPTLNTRYPDIAEPLTRVYHQGGISGAGKEAFVMYALLAIADELDERFQLSSNQIEAPRAQLRA